jgi:hypothetical protein
MGSWFYSSEKKPEKIVECCNVNRMCYVRIQELLVRSEITRFGY